MLAQADKGRVITGRKDVRQPERLHEPRSLHSIAEGLRRAVCETISATVGKGRFLWATRHVFRHRHRRFIDGRLIGGNSRGHRGGHGHGWPCNRANNKPDDCQDAEQTANGRQKLHLWSIIQFMCRNAKSAKDAKCRKGRRTRKAQGAKRNQDSIHSQAPS
jgi:hypothetical protein